MAVVLQAHCGRGIPQYSPSNPTHHSNTPHRHFRARRAAAGRIRIKPLHEWHPEYDLSKLAHPLGDSSHSIGDKLAVSREAAKRLLRSVIAQNSDASSQTASSSDKRRFSLPPRRSSQADGDEQTASMRGISRIQADGPAPTTQRARASVDARSQSPSLPSAPNGTKRTSSNDTIPMSTLDEEKPVASGNGVSVGIHLAEPVLFLQGFDNADTATGNTAMLRGSLHVRVQKSAKIKAITLKFKGRALTKWPEGIPPRKTDFEETNTIMNHTWPFFNAQFDSAETSTGADHVHPFKTTEPTNTGKDSIGRSSPNASTANLTSKEARRLSLQANKSRSFTKDDPVKGPSVATKGYRNFHPGDYIYNFELPLDSRLPETIDVELGNVKYELEATIERSGAFRANLAGSKEVTLIRAPAEGSLEQVEPIAISRNWEDQLHYDIVISGKSFPLGSQVPIAFKLTPLAKVQCHRIKVLVTENIEYFCANKHVHRMEPPRKVQLFEKRSDSDPTSAFPGSTMRITAGGGIPYDARARAARGESVVPADTANLLGALEGDTNVGPTEMEFNVQLPSCHAMKDRDRHQRLHFDTTYSNIQVHHWIKVSCRHSILKRQILMPGRSSCVYQSQMPTILQSDDILRSLSTRHSTSSPVEPHRTTSHYRHTHRLSKVEIMRICSTAGAQEPQNDATLLFH